MPSKNIAASISDKEKKSWGSSSHVTSLATTSTDKDADYIVDQDVDVDVILAGAPIHSLLSQQELEGGILDDDLDEESNKNNPLEVVYNASVYAGGKTLLLLSIKPDYQLALVVQMSLLV